MSTRDSPGGKGGRYVRLTTYHPCSAERQEIRGLNLPGPPWAISTACCGRDLYLYYTFQSVTVTLVYLCQYTFQFGCTKMHDDTNIQWTLLYVTKYTALWVDTTWHWKHQYQYIILQSAPYQCIINHGIITVTIRLSEHYIDMMKSKTSL